jgi:protein-tyrosine phosphatase
VIDLHCHMLPGIDDGARDLDTALAMARMAAEDGIEVTACTPHIYPGLYENATENIGPAVDAFRGAVEEAGISLQLTFGADIQIVPELLAGLRRGTHPTLHGSRYFLFEPPHHTVPVRFADTLFDTLAAGYTPIITHPERLTWLDDEHYDWFVDAAADGAWIQLTAAALTGAFGRRAQYWSERMLDDGIVHILATDAHDPDHRPPILSAGRDAAAKWVGAEEARRMVDDRPRAVLADLPAGGIVPPPAQRGEVPSKRRAKERRGWFGRLFSGAEVD